MLLSLPTWIIHLLTVSEWLAAILLIRRYAIAIERPRLELFAFAMIPHLIGGLFVLAFHVGGDRAQWLIGWARLFTFAGSLSLLAATLLMLRPTRIKGAWLAALVLTLGLCWGAWRLLSAGGPAALLPGTNLAYVTFLVTLLLLYRKEGVLFSPISVFGFWCLLVFVAVTIAATQVATQRLGLPSLTHADLLHGASESLLSVSNFLIALGAYRRLRALTNDR
jgi:hypothetical protein